MSLYTKRYPSTRYSETNLCSEAVMYWWGSPDVMGVSVAALSEASFFEASGTSRNRLVHGASLGGASGLKSSSVRDCASCTKNMSLLA